MSDSHRHLAVTQSMAKRSAADAFFHMSIAIWAIVGVVVAWSLTPHNAVKWAVAIWILGTLAAFLAGTAIFYFHRWLCLDRKLIDMQLQERA